MAYIDHNVTASLLIEFLNQGDSGNHHPHSLSYPSSGDGDAAAGDVSHDVRKTDYDVMAGLYDDMPSFPYPGDIDQLRKPWLNQDSLIPRLAVMCAIFVTGVAGNSLVIAALWQGRAGRCATFPCLISMAWADLLFLVVCVPHAVVTAIVFYWSLSDFLCKLSGFVEGLTANATVLNLILISIERYLVIAHPLNSRRICTLRNARIALVCTWIAAILFACPAFVITGTDKTRFYNNETSVVVVMCVDTDDHRLTFAIWKVVTLFILPICVLLFCYIRVIVILWVSNKQLQTLIQPNSVNASPRSESGRLLQPMSSVSSSSSSAQTRVRLCATHRAGEDALQARRQIIKMLIVVIFIFLVCWGPKLIVHALKQLRLSMLYEYWWSYIPNMIFEMLPYFQSCINPIIYATMSKNIRKGIRQVPATYCARCCCRCCCCPKQWRLSINSPVHHEMMMNTTTHHDHVAAHSVMNTTTTTTIHAPAATTVISPSRLENGKARLGGAASIRNNSTLL